MKCSVGSNKESGFSPKVAALTPRTGMVSGGVSGINGITRISSPGQKLVLLPDIQNYSPFRLLLRHICKWQYWVSFMFSSIFSIWHNCRHDKNMWTESQENIQMNQQFDFFLFNPRILTCWLSGLNVTTISLRP